MTRVLVCGSRDWTDPEPIRAFLAGLPADAVVVHGAAPGADRIAGQLAAERGLAVEPVPAEWQVHAPGWCRCRKPLPRYCKAAGSRRNQEMLDRGVDRAGAFPLPSSRGTWDMVNRLRAAKVPVYICEGA